MKNPWIQYRIWATLIGLLFIAYLSLSHKHPGNKLLRLALEKQQTYSGEVANDTNIIIVDYSKSIFENRLWVIDGKTHQVKMAARVSHALKSGFIWPTEFSNVPGSNLSSYGCFVTEESYKSQFGKGEYQIGMRLKGLEPGINDKVRERYIVFHSFPIPLYSDGCFITMPKTNKKIIEMTRNGCFLYVHK